MSTDAATSETVSLQHLKSTPTPLLDQLSEKHQVFVLTLYLTGNLRHSARKAGFADDTGRELARRPHIEAALREQHTAAVVQVAPTPLEIVLRLWHEAQNLTSNAQSRISALKALADIKGMTGGGGNESDSALDQFYREAGRAVTAGVFDGLQAAGRKLGAGGVEGVDAGAREGAVCSLACIGDCEHVSRSEGSEPEGVVVEVDAKVVEVDLGAAFEVPAKEVE